MGGCRVARDLDIQDRAAWCDGVVGHGDWESQNIRWVDRQAHVVHDWDSVVVRGEPSLAGAAAAVFPASGEAGAATVEETAAFLDAYCEARGLTWSRWETAAAWAAGVWVRAFNAKKRIAHGLEPGADLPRSDQTPPARPPIKCRLRTFRRGAG